MNIHFAQSTGCGLLLALMAALAGPGTAAAPSSPQGLITARGFLDIGSGTAISDLTGNAKFPNNPDVVYYYPYFEWNATGDIFTAANNAYADNYGAQMIGYFYPPTTGDYVFLFSSDDNGNLYLSTDDTAANKKLIAQETGWSNARSWDVVGSGALEPKNSSTFATTEWPTKDPVMGGAKITLTKGKAYYIEALVKEGGGGDNLAVAVQAPDGSIDYTAPIPGQYLSTFDKTEGPAKIITQPQSQTIDEGNPVTFKVEADGTPPYAYQWKKNGVNIADATNQTYTITRASHTDNGAKFSVAVTGAQGSATSGDAILTVNPDTIPPTVLLASTRLGTSVIIEYSEYMDAVSATTTANYSIPGITFTGATISDDGMVVTLPITGNLPANFEVTIGGVKDFAGNAIPAGTKVPGYTTGLAPNMVSYWPLDVVEGTKTPDIISGYDMNLVNLTSADLITGRFAKCIKFDNARQTMLRRIHGTNEALPIYNHKAFTVSIWVNGPLQTDRRVFSESSSKNNQPLFNLGTHNTGADGTLDTYIRNDSGTTSGDHHHHIGVPFDETWHHICYVQNSNASPQAIVYIDGVKDDLDPSPVWPMAFDTTTIGGIQRAAAAAWFTGMIDDVAVWSRALDPEEVSFLFTKGTPTPPPKVLPLTINSFRSELPAVAKGDSVKLHWDVSKDATSVSIQPDIGDVTAETQIGVGSKTITLTTSKTYRLTVKRGADSVSSEIKIAAIDGIATGWTLLDNFDRYSLGVIPKPWGVSGVNATIVDVNGNLMLSVGGGGDAMAALPLNDLTVKEGDQRTLFARFYLARTVDAGGVTEYMGLSDKGIRSFGDSDGELGPDVGFYNDSGPVTIGTWNGVGATFEPSSFTIEPMVPYNLWINVRNDPIADGDLVSIFAAKEGTASRTTLFQDYRSDRNPTPAESDLIGYPTRPDLQVLTVGGNTTSSVVYFDDFYLSKSGYLTTVPRAYGFTTPIEDIVVQAPTIKSVRIEGGNLTFALDTQSGVNYLVEGRANLFTGDWQTAQTVAGTGQTVTVSLPMSVDSQFYRIRVQ
ncbi:MAG TPA: PA14 domain-containing protein [Candidatus Paceibacterota bacterium]|nr:PA14 domain-containing protein [Verrucomicrobiota bacterium]HRY49262.1 PA14 domain-containing protein [Candidatus Paceibacterota bacterium]